MIRTRTIFGIPLVRSKARQRFVIAYWVVVGFLLALLCQFALQATAAPGIPYTITLAVLLILPLILGGFSRGGAVDSFADVGLKPEVLADIAVRPGFAGHQERLGIFRDLDERQTQIRDHAHYLSYTLVAWFMLLMVVITWILAMFDPGSLIAFGKIAFALPVIGVWSLPQTLILWREPDPEIAEAPGA